MARLGEGWRSPFRNSRERTSIQYDSDVLARHATSRESGASLTRVSTSVNRSIEHDQSS